MLFHYAGDLLYWQFVGDFSKPLVIHLLTSQ